MDTFAAAVILDALVGHRQFKPIIAGTKQTYRDNLGQPGRQEKHLFQ